MNYEDLYTALQEQEKNMKAGLASLQKLLKKVEKETESGDIKGLSGDLDTMADTADDVSKILENVQEMVSGFDTRAYFETGEFAQQMLDCCRAKDVNVRGEFPVYEMFPYRVRIDVEAQEIYLDRKKIQCVRPESFAGLVKSGQEKLNRATFNEKTFLNELADAYDLAILRQNKRPESDIYLMGLYKFLAPMSRFRKDYDQQSFAFDIARLYASDAEETKDGRRYQFGPSRNQNKSIRILDKDGQEQYLATIRFYK